MGILNGLDIGRGKLQVSSCSMDTLVCGCLFLIRLPTSSVNRRLFAAACLTPVRWSQTPSDMSVVGPSVSVKKSNCILR
jgi:hypothetical protein